MPRRRPQWLDVRASSLSFQLVLDKLVKQNALSPANSIVFKREKHPATTNKRATHCQQRWQTLCSQGR
jgi:hypothetical protein